jgi:hypothetical protein
MKRSASLAAIWVVCLIGIRLDWSDSVWRTFVHVGLGGHSFGVLFVWIPLLILAFEWVSLLGIPVLLIWEHIKTKRSG